MEVGKMLTYMMFVLIPIVAIIIYISISSQVISECKSEIGGTKFSVLGSLKNCVNACWSKHNFGQDVFSDDCFIVTVSPNTTITKSEMEKFFGAMTKVYFDSFDSNSVYKIKVKYNSTGKEISLTIFEKIQ
jgi:hypothetical protein